MIAARKIFLGSLIAAFFLFSGRAWGALPCPATPQVYVSSASQIVCVDATTGAITVLLTDNSSSFGDISFGPDGLLYFTDVLGSRVFRIDPKITTATPATLVATIPTGTNTITGLAFSASNGLKNGDLYVNASTGVFLIAGIACVGCSPSLPITPTQAITFSSPITAGGLAFDVFSKGEPETMTIVDQSGQILQSAFPFTSAKFLANVSNVGPGIFANFCGDTLVASGTNLVRLIFSFDPITGNLVVTQSTYVNLGDTVRYFEVAADNTVYATTFSNGAGGIVSSVAPAKDPSTGVPSCAATPTVTQIAFFKAAAKAGTIQSAVANGVAIGPTSITISESFSPAVLSQIYNFGLYKFTITFDTVYQSFMLSFKAVRSRQADIIFSPAAFQPGTVPMHFSPLGGFAVQVVTPNPGDPGAVYSCFDTGGIQTGLTDYGLCPTDPSAVQMRWSFSTDDVPVDPGVARDTSDFLFLNPPSGTETYVDDLTHDVWLADPLASGGTKTLNCTFLANNKGLVQNLTAMLSSPTASCGTTTTPTCNPQFNIGQSVTFKITFSPSTSIAPISRLSIAKVHVASDGTVQIDQTINVFSKKNANIDNLFTCSTSVNQCSYNWDSSGAEVPGAGPGLYQATIFSDSFPPLIVYLTLK